MKQMRVVRRIFPLKGRGFALPTVLIASVVMLSILTTTLIAVVSSRGALSSQYYQQLARTAAESGLVKAQVCLQASNYTPQWTAAQPLRPNTDCSGNVLSGASAYVLSNTGVRSTFTVGAASTLANGVQRVSVNATASLLRTSTGTEWRTFSAQTNALVSAPVSFEQVTFGYTSQSGAFFATIDAQGRPYTVGYNGLGQLGNGTTQNVVTPTQFILPAGARAQAMYSNFLSVGYALFAVTQDGRLFGAGNNDSGQLGNGTVSATQSTPVQFGLPSGVTARYVALLRQSTFVIGSDNNIYSAGACAYGQLGSGYTISGCTNRSTRVRVALPTVNTSQPNTLPVVNSDWVQSTNLAADRHNVYVRMQGGAVYGWGANEYGQLGNGTTTDSATPVKIGTWGDAGQPQATQLAYDGETLYVLDSSGQVHAVGKNNLGSLAGAKAPIMGSTGFCLDNPGNTSTIRTRIRIYTCNNSTAQKLEWTSEGELKFRPNSSSEFCVDNANNSSANGNPIQLYTCNGTVAQKWQYRDDGSIYHPSTGRCIDNPGNSASSGTEIQLYQCNATPAQAWNLQPTLVPERVPIPASSGRVTRITTDQWSTLFLTEDGKVWGAGGNERGMLGRGSANVMNPALSQFILPSGRTAVDFYTTKAGVTNSEYGNTYVILDDGSVYGAGANTFGQLGIGTTSTQENTPRRMNLPSGVRARSVQSGLGTTLVLTDQGQIYTVGNNQHGQLGDGTTNNSSTPKANIYTNVVPVTYY